MGFAQPTHIAPLILKSFWTFKNICDGGGVFIRKN